MLQWEAGGLGAAARTLIGSWRDLPSRGDFIANVLFYMPFGFFAILAAGGGARRIAVIAVGGALLSTGMELTQFFDAGRVTAATDLYANTLGTVLGAVGGSLAGRGFRWPLLREIATHRVPTLLLAAWLGYRLYPYVPTIDLHKYWHALRPVIVRPALTGYDLFRHAAVWLTVAALVEEIVGPRRQWLLFPLFVGSVLAGKVLIVSTMLSPAEVAGAGLALFGWVALAVNPRLRLLVVTLLFCAYVIAARLAPFQFGSGGKPFGWIPFLGFMSGAIEINVLSFLEKVFLYGGVIWLLCKIGLRLRLATVVTAVVLFLTSQAEVYLPNRSAEITDALLAVMLGVVFRMIEARAGDAGDGFAANSPPAWRRPANWPH